MNEKMDYSPKNVMKSLLPIIYLFIILFALRWTLVEPYVVPTGSMEPTLKTGDRLYALKCAYDIRFPFTDWVLFRTQDVKRGDVILFRNPNDPGIIFVKRAIGLPGDRIEYRDGQLFVNGVEVTKTVFPDSKIMYDIENANQKTLYLETLGGVRHYVIMDNLPADLRSYVERERMKYISVTVPENMFFAMGDNRDNSSDSRFWGFVPRINLKGRAMFLWFSSWDWRIRPERIGTLIQ